MVKTIVISLFATCAAILFADVAFADETVVYTYDELGRLKTSSTTEVDFTDTNGTLTFAANEKSKTVSFLTIDDGLVESNEPIWLAH